MLRSILLALILALSALFVYIGDALAQDLVLIGEAEREVRSRQPLLGTSLLVPAAVVLFVVLILACAFGMKYADNRRDVNAKSWWAICTAVVVTRDIIGGLLSPEIKTIKGLVRLLRAVVTRFIPWVWKNTPEWIIYVWACAWTYGGILKGHLKENVHLHWPQRA